MKSWILALLLVAFAAGCATERAAEQKAKDDPAATAAAVPVAEEKAEEGAEANKKKPLAEDEVELICELEPVIGSNIRRRVCRTSDEVERQRREAQEFMRRPRRQPQADQ